MNILLTSVGRRGYMIEYFRQALSGIGEVHAGNSVETYALKEADAYVITPPIYNNDYVPFLKNYCETNNIKAIIPLFDIDIPVLSIHAEEFLSIGVKVLAPSPYFAKVCNDKWKTYCFLKKHGIQTPATYLSAEESIKAISQGFLTYPLVVKPRWGMGSIGVYIADNENELSVFINKVNKAITNSYLKYESESNLKQAVIIQEKLNGEEYGLDIINDLNGNNVTIVPKQKLAMRAGETDIAKIFHHPLLSDMGKILGTLSKHKGNLDVDCFIINNQVYVLEMNCRFGGQYPFSHLAGINLPAQIVKWLQGGGTDTNLLKINTPCIACKELTPVILDFLV